eukprot:COSAG05_NODE_8343_length_712_cov_1.305057_1_plen_25_part_10
MDGMKSKIAQYARLKVSHLLPRLLS